MPLSRRELGLLLPAMGGLLLPRRARADAASERKFLFVFCPGGWDPAFALAPVFGGVADMPDGAVPGSAGGIDFVDSPMSPAVGSFFNLHGGRTCLIHGVEARSVAHDVCLRLILTGQSNPGHDDWPLLLSADSGTPFTLPYVNLSGPSYAGSRVSSLVRVGENGQLAALLDGSAVDAADLPIQRPGTATAGRVQSLLDARLARWAAGAGRGQEARIASAALASESNLADLMAVSDELDLAGGETLSERASVALECLERGLSRVGMVEHYGWSGLSWDTHGANFLQSSHFQELFSELALIMQDLQTRTSLSGTPLADEVTVVVMSEMGRYPVLNTRAGKEHWTFTSAMLIGSGIRGGQSIGGYDSETYRGLGVDLGTGGSGDTPLVPNHLGATLLTLGGLDPVALLGAEPIAAAVEGA
jgi:hypothetical protein